MWRAVTLNLFGARRLSTSSCSCFSSSQCLPQKSQPTAFDSQLVLHLPFQVFSPFLNLRCLMIPPLQTFLQLALQIRLLWIWAEKKNMKMQHARPPPFHQRGPCEQQHLASLDTKWSSTHHITEKHGSFWGPNEDLSYTANVIDFLTKSMVPHCSLDNWHFPPCPLLLCTAKVTAANSDLEGKSQRITICVFQQQFWGHHIDDIDGIDIEGEIHAARTAPGDTAASPTLDVWKPDRVQLQLVERYQKYIKSMPLFDHVHSLHTLHTFQSPVGTTKAAAEERRATGHRLEYSEVNPRKTRGVSFLLLTVSSHGETCTLVSAWRLCTEKFLAIYFVTFHQ